MEKILKKWIEYKIRYAKRNGHIRNVHAEETLMNMHFPNEVPTVEGLEKQGIKYIPDRIFNIIPFDYQFDCCAGWKRGGGDCNTLNRMIQICLINMNIQAYLVTWLSTPLLSFKWHTTCIAYDKGVWWSFDYGYKRFASKSFDMCLKKIGDKHGTRIKCHVKQDKNLDIV